MIFHEYDFVELYLIVVYVHFHVQDLDYVQEQFDKHQMDILLEKKNNKYEWHHLLFNRKIRKISQHDELLN